MLEDALEIFNNTSWFDPDAILEENKKNTKLYVQYLRCRAVVYRYVTVVLSFSYCLRILLAKGLLRKTLFLEQDMLLQHRILHLYRHSIKYRGQDKHDHILETYVFRVLRFLCFQQAFGESCNQR